MVVLRSLGGPLIVMMLLAYGVSWGLLEVPYGYWQRLFIDKLAHGQYAAEFLTYSAAVGDLKTVETFLSKGVPVGARNSSGATALHAAAVEGRLEVAEYLLTKGADVNAINRYGDSPLQDAISMKRSEVVKLLVAKGGQRIRGSPEQRDNASKKIVREQMQETDKQRAK